jgi:hypothetical protein
MEAKRKTARLTCHVRRTIECTFLKPLSLFTAVFLWLRKFIQGNASLSLNSSKIENTINCE